jgi:hypothetical protein
MKKENKDNFSYSKAFHSEAVNKRKNEPTIHATKKLIRHNLKQIPLGKLCDNKNVLIQERERW